MHALTTTLRAELATPYPRVGACSLSTVGLSLGVLALGWGAVGVVAMVALLPLALAAYHDLISGRIPDQLVVLGAVPVVALTVASSIAGDPTLAGQALLGAGLLAGPLFLIHLVSPLAMGFGDVKLALVLGAVVGLFDPLHGLVALCFACAGTALWGVSRQRLVLPFGPGLALATIAVLVFAALTGAEPSSWR